MKEEIEWFERALRDIEIANHNFNGNFFEVAAFYSHQAVEKALKAIIISKGENFPKIHDLVNLAKQNNAPIEIIKLCAKINPAYITTRYPDVKQEYFKENVKNIVEASQEVIEWAKKQANSWKT